MELSDSEHQSACPHWLSTRVFRGFSVGLDSSCADQALWKVITNLEGDVSKNHKKSSRRGPSHTQTRFFNRSDAGQEGALHCRECGGKAGYQCAQLLIVIACHPGYAPQEKDPEPKLKDLNELLKENSLISTMALLMGETLQSLEAMLTEDRPTFLASLKEKGVDNLAERQKLANAIGKAKRLDRF